MHHKPQENIALPPTPVPHSADSYHRSDRRRGGRNTVQGPTQMGNESGQFLCLYQNCTRMLNVTIRENTFWIMFQMMIQSMDKSECTKTLHSRRHKTKPGTNTNARFLTLQVLSRELPKERANQVVE